MSMILVQMPSIATDTNNGATLVRTELKWEKKNCHADLKFKELPKNSQLGEKYADEMVLSFWMCRLEEKYCFKKFSACSSNRENIQLLQHVDKVLTITMS